MFFPVTSPLRFLVFVGLVLVLLSSCYSIHTRRKLGARTRIDHSGIGSFLVGVGNENFSLKKHLSVMDSEFLDSFRSEASTRGWRQVFKPDGKSPIIVLRLVEPPPSSQSFSYSAPTYGMVGGGTSTFGSTTHFSGGGSATTSGSIYTQPTLQQTGTMSFGGTYPTYTYGAYINCVSPSNESLFEVESTIFKYCPITDKDRRQLMQKAVKAMATNIEE